MTTYDHKAIACPECSEELDRSTSLLGQPGGPGLGDTTVCLRCLAILVFEDGPSLRKMTDTEQIAMEQQFPDEFTVISRARDSIRKGRGYI